MGSLRNRYPGEDCFFPIREKITIPVFLVFQQSVSVVNHVSPYLILEVGFQTFLLPQPASQFVALGMSEALVTH